MLTVASLLSCALVGTTLRSPTASAASRSLIHLLTDDECNLPDQQIVSQPGLSSRFGKAWEALSEDVDWAALLAERALDALDDGLTRRRGGVEAVETDQRPRVVLLGTGWGAQALLSHLDGEQFDVTVVSPRAYFLFTPMLAGAALGTLEPRSIIEPIRASMPKHSQYFEAEATQIDAAARVVSCESTADGECTKFDVQYDLCVVAVGAAPNTFGIPGVREHCLFLKQIGDAMRFREKLSAAFERASLPGLSETRLAELLTFVVIGAGPTGVELCGELRDYVEQDVPRLYRRLLPHVRIVLLEASDKVLMAFDSDMQEAALQRLKGSGGVSVDVRTSAGVSEVKEKTIILSDGEVLPYGVAVWAAGARAEARRMRARLYANTPHTPLLPSGIGTLDLVSKTSAAIPGQAEHAQAARGRLAVDQFMRVIGAPGMLAFGDCAHVTTGALPATAQVASQAGTYLGRLLTDGYDLAADTPAPVLPESAPGTRTLRSMLRGANKGVAPPFRFLNLGILAYVGGSEALVQVDVGGQGKKLKNAGRAGFALWRSVYLSKQYGLRNRMLVAVDWLKARVFGRDISRL